MSPVLGVAQRQAMGETLVELGRADDSVVVLDGDVGGSTGAALFSQAHRRRFVQTGIAEQNMAAMAAGLATVGYKPYMTTFACFAVARALDPIRVLIAQPALDVKIMGGYAGLLTGKTGKTHQMLNDLAIMRSMPSVTVIAPADEHELRAAMRTLIDIPGPAYVQVCREATPVLFEPGHRFVLGKGVLIREGLDVSLISTGPQSVRTLEAAQALARRGIDADVLHLATVQPIDEEAIVRTAEKTGLVITVEEQDVHGGLGGAVAEVLGERCPVPVHRLGLRDRYGESGSNGALLDKYRLSPPRVAEDVAALLAARSLNVKTPGHAERESGRSRG